MQGSARAARTLAVRIPWWLAGSVPSASLVLGVSLRRPTRMQWVVGGTAHRGGRRPRARTRSGVIPIGASGLALEIAESGPAVAPIPADPRDSAKASRATRHGDRRNMLSLMPRWVLGIVFLVGAHLSASYLTPLDEQAQRTFLGLLKWAWPWAYGEHGPLGELSPEPSGFPLGGFFIAATSAGLLFPAALSVLGWWVPFGWWRPLAVAGAGVQLILMASFAGPTKLMPIALDALILYATLSRSW